MQVFRATSFSLDVEERINRNKVIHQEQGKRGEEPRNELVATDDHSRGQQVSGYRRFGLAEHLLTCRVVLEKRLKFRCIADIFLLSLGAYVHIGTPASIHGPRKNNVNYQQPRVRHFNFTILPAWQASGSRVACFETYSVYVCSTRAISLSMRCVVGMWG